MFHVRGRGFVTLSPKAHLRPYTLQELKSYEPSSELLKGGHIRDYIGDYYRGYQGGY